MGATCQPEWNRIDLLVTTSTGRNVAIEFKFYVLRQSRPLDAESHARSHWKGGAGRNNEGDFEICVKICDLRHKLIHEKYLVLVYDRNNPGKASFEDSYNDFRLKECFELMHLRSRTAGVMLPAS